MKTFDEAIEVIVCTSLDQATELLAKHNEFIAEVKENETLRLLVGDIITLVGAGEMTAEGALATMFFNGMIVGREMEKRDE